MIVANNLTGSDAIRHGFFSRQGGVSEGLYDSLNCGFSSGDDTARVSENRARAMAQLGMPVQALCTVHQVHSARVLITRKTLSGPQAVEADALVSNLRGIAIGVLCADCAPVLIADHEAGVIGCAHAGWRGALAGVIEATAATMVELGARPERMSAAVGPCIAQASYEVGPDLQSQFLDHDPSSGDLFEPVEGSDRLLFDLKQYALRRLERAGVEDRIALPHDTLAQADRFFSARRTRQRGGERFGLLLSAIALAEPA